MFMLFRVIIDYQFSFQMMKNWLDEHNDYEAIVDGANIGLYQQNFAEGGFSVSQVVYIQLLFDTCYVFVTF